MRNSVCLIFLLISFIGFAQPEDAQIEVINGKRFYVHIVRSGNTLYGIHNLYKVPVEDIIAANPDAAKGLSEGQRILVPIAGMEGLAENLIIHTVAPKETLYGISKKYDTSVDRLVELNPGIDQGLKEGQEIKVPYKLPVGKADPVKKDQKEVRVTFKDSIINHTVMKGETLYSISKRFMVPTEELKRVNDMKSDRLKPGDLVKIPIKKESIERVEVREITPPKDGIKPVAHRKDSIFLFKKKEEYNIAILMPLFLDKTEGYNASVANLAAEFYMGTKFALDSLQALGLKAKVYIHDSKNDSVTVMALLKKPEFTDMDLIIGPFFATNAEYVSRWCKERGIRMICPVATNYEILRNNPYIYESVTSDVTLAEKLAKYIYKTQNKEQIILVKPKSEKDNVLHMSFRSAFNNMTTNKDNLPKIIETNLEDFTTFVKPNENIRLVFLSSDKGDVGTFLTSLTRATEKNETGIITVFGTKDWENYSNIEVEQLAKFNAHYVTPFDLNYKNPRTKNFDKGYRKVYRTQVSKMALQGYDVTMYFCQTLLMGKTPQRGIMNQFNLEQKGEGNGFENTNCIIMKHNEYGFVKLLELND